MYHDFICLSSFTLNELIEVHSATEDGSLFHSLTTLFVKKNLVQSSCTCLHLNSIPVFLVREESSIRNNLFVNPLCILKHSISFPLRRRFFRENKFSCEKEREREREREIFLALTETVLKICFLYVSELMK